MTVKAYNDGRAMQQAGGWGGRGVCDQHFVEIGQDLVRRGREALVDEDVHCGVCVVWRRSDLGLDVRLKSAHRRRPAAAKLILAEDRGVADIVRQDDDCRVGLQGETKGCVTARFLLPQGCVCNGLPRADVVSDGGRITLLGSLGWQWRGSCR